MRPLLPGRRADSSQRFSAQERTQCIPESLCARSAGSGNYHCLAGAQAGDDTRALLFENYLNAAGEKDRELIANVTSELALSRAKPAGQRSELSSPLQSYRIRLNIMRQRSAKSDGMYVLGRFNGGKPLKLQLDTGASGILLNPRAAEAAGLTALAPSKVFGLGDAGWQKTHIGLAERFGVGDVAWTNVPVEFGERKLLGNCDGLLGTDIFSAFEIRLNIPQETLELSPLPAYADGNQDWREHDRIIPENTPGALLARRVGHSLLVPVIANQKLVSHFLVDTGSSVNLIADEFARRFTNVGTVETVKMKGVSGDVGKLYAATLVRLQFGHFVQEEHNMLAVKLDDLSDMSGVQINGILGWSTLSRLVVSLNYRDGIIDFVHPSESGKGK